MKGNAKKKLEEALDEICCCENHLNEAYIHTMNDLNRTEIHAALKSVGSALNSAQEALESYVD